jgi:hypothetical protein
MSIALVDIYNVIRGGTLVLSIFARVTTGPETSGNKAPSTDEKHRN